MNHIVSALARERVAELHREARVNRAVKAGATPRARRRQRPAL